MVNSCDIVRCAACDLNQFRTRNNLCRRCFSTLVADVETHIPESVPIFKIVKQDAPQRIADAAVFQKSLAAVIVTQRHARRLSQRKFAVLCGNLPRTYISKLERGGLMPTLTTVLKVAHGLHMTASELVILIETEMVA